MPRVGYDPPLRAVGELHTRRCAGAQRCRSGRASRHGREASKVHPSRKRCVFIHAVRRFSLSAAQAARCAQRARSSLPFEHLRCPPAERIPDDLRTRRRSACGIRLRREAGSRGSADPARRRCPSAERHALRGWPRQTRHPQSPRVFFAAASCQTQAETRYLENRPRVRAHSRLLHDRSGVRHAHHGDELGTARHGVSAIVLMPQGRAEAC
eukprot:scaffold2923_cov313-Pinguiococcus_pyrenoidosus.AAC.23